MSIYKPCDIRGPSSEFSPELYHAWGLSLGLELPEGSPFVIGGDVRLSTPAFLNALADGLVASGMHVVNIGIQPTPIIYFQKRFLKAPGCAIVTASHHPPAHNGLKWMIGTLPPTEEDVTRLKESAQSRKLRGRHPGRVVCISPTEYGSWLRARFATTSVHTRVRVVLDPGNGCWAAHGQQYVQNAFPKSCLLSIHSTPDGLFPNRDPDCAQRENLTRLCESVLANHSDMGVAFDGDGDRVAFVDNEGTALSPEEAAWILIQSFGASFLERKFVHDIKFSDRVGDAVRALGGTPIAERSGHAFIRTRMIRETALFGAEISGHYFYDELEGGDDGLFTACRLLEYLGETGLSLADLRRTCPHVYLTPDIRLQVFPDPRAFLQQVRTAFADFPQSYVDGVRVDFPQGWALVRASVTEDKVTLRFEGDSEPGLKGVVQLFAERMPEVAGRLETESGIRPKNES